ncbi:MAG TPA: DMT family transporter [Nevskiaceae bacterium]
MARVENPEPEVSRHALRVAWSAMAAIVVISGFSFTVMKIATFYSGPFTFSAQRYVIGTVALFVALLVTRSRLKPTPWLPTIIIGLTQTCGFQALAQLALTSGAAGKTTLLLYTMPFWVVPMAWLLLHERPNRRRWLYIGLACVGFACVVEPWGTIGTPRSILLALLGGLVWSVATVLSKRVFRQHPEVTPLQLTAWQMLVGAIALVVVLAFVPERQTAWGLPYIGTLLYTGILSSALSWALWAIVVQRLPANVAGLAALAVPVATVFFSWAALGERPSPSEWIGIVLVGAALIGLNLFASPRRPRSAGSRTA